MLNPNAMPFQPSTVAGAKVMLTDAEDFARRLRERVKGGAEVTEEDRRRCIEIALALSGGTDEREHRKQEKQAQLDRAHELKVRAGAVVKTCRTRIRGLPQWKVVSPRLTTISE